LCYCLVFIIHSLWSQEKMLTIDESVAGLDYHLRPKRLSQLQWRVNSEYLTYNLNDKMIQQNVIQNDSIVLFLLEDINLQLEVHGVPVMKAIPSISWIDMNRMYFIHDRTYYEFDLEEKKITTILETDKNADNITVDPKHNAIAFTIDNNLYIRGVEGNIQITYDNDPGILNGTSNIHRHEFGIDKGIFWSPGANYLAFYRKDETMVSDYPLVDVTSRVAELNNIKYPMAGMTNEQVTVCVYDIQNGKTITLNTGKDEDQFLTSVTWDPEEKYIYIALINREQDHLKLNRYDIHSGESVGTLFEEHHPKYIEPEDPLLFLENDNEKFIWQSERDGYKHLYLYDVKGKLVKQLTKGGWDVTSVEGFDQSGRYLFYTSTQVSPIEKHLFKLDLRSGKTLQLSNEHGTHRNYLHPDGTYLIDEYSNTEIPLNYIVKDSKGNELQTIYSASDPMDNYNLGEIQLFTLKAADSVTDLYCRMIKPVDFDPGTKYPVIIYVYGGPHSQMVTDIWMAGARMWQHYMAQRGYIAFTMDNRGTSNRGLEFENIIHRQLGKIEVEDQIKGVEYLRSLPYVDKDRIGIHGWSYGGFMTISMLSRYPEYFKAGVAGGPVIDWKYYEIMYGERYMDTPQSNPEGYEQSSLLNQVGQFTGKLMIIHGGQDDIVVWQNSLEYLIRCIQKGIQLDYFVYPSHKHNVRGKDRIHLMQKVSDYFFEFL